VRQRPSTQAELPRRERSQGFSAAPLTETITLSDPVTVERSQPVHFSIQNGVADPVSERERRFAQHRGSYSAGPLLVSRLPGALVDTSRFVICPDERHYLLDSFRHPRGLVRWGYTHVEGDIYERELSEPIEEREERVVVLGAQANRNYSHWLLESAVRVLLFAPFDDGSTLYLTPRLEPWQREALALVGVDEARLLTIPRRRLVRFPEVFAVSRGLARMPDLIPDALSVLAALARPAVIPGRRLFVSRASVERRHISNEPQLVDVLEHHGFQTVHPEQLTVAEQVELFASAETILGSWGSGMTNVLFGPPGMLVIELQQEEVDFGGNAFVWNIASIRGQSFAQVVCPVTEGMRQLPLGERDMTVDVHEIDALLGRLLAA
jgi:hypothetical protein